MIKHIVLFKLTSFETEEEKEGQIARLDEIFSVFSSKPGLAAGYRTGRNVTSSEQAWDFAIDSAFASMEDLLKYQESDEHRDAVRKASQIGKQKATIDFEY